MLALLSVAVVARHRRTIADCITYEKIAPVIVFLAVPTCIVTIYVSSMERSGVDDVSALPRRHQHRADRAGDHVFFVMVVAITVALRSMCATGPYHRVPRPEI